LPPHRFDRVPEEPLNLLLILGAAHGGGNENNEKRKNQSFHMQSGSAPFRNYSPDRGAFQTVATAIGLLSI